MRTSRSLWQAVLLLVAAVGGALFMPARSTAQQIVNQVVASVDGEPITMHDVQAFGAATGVTMPDPHDPNAPAIIRTVLKGLISQKLLEQEVKNYEGDVDDAAVDRYIDDIRQENHMSEEEFRAQVVNSGTSWDDFRKRARLELQKMAMIQKQVRAKVEITPEQIKAYYDAHLSDFTATSEHYKLAQILIAADPKAPPKDIAAARAQADAIRKRAAAGEDFAALARQYSDDASRDKGGELGEFSPDEMLDEIKAAVAKLKPGEVSDVVQTSHGFHIIKVEQHQLPGPRPLAEVSDEIRERLLDDATKERLQVWVDRDLIKNHHVESYY